MLNLNAAELLTTEILHMVSLRANKGIHSSINLSCAISKTFYFLCRVMVTDTKKCPADCDCVYEGTNLFVRCKESWDSTTLDSVAKITFAM